MTILSETQSVDSTCQLILIKLLLPICVKEFKYILDNCQLPPEVKPSRSVNVKMHSDRYNVAL